MKRMAIGLGNTEGVGLGKNNRTKHNNEWSENEKINELIEQISDEIIPLFFAEGGGCNFSIRNFDKTIELVFGVGISCPHVAISSEIYDCELRQSKNIGVYGDDFISIITKYINCENKTKLFFEKWSSKLKDLMNLKKAEK